ncbi:hypothetical protein PILCRDRAFT_502086 [Piloderma croceum F 1598]|uniref:Uncharacterized protein n=1 Tax=Piloderma croceum (strain F 1598) TaxID=765440 RepID=A0A0C3B5D5_PILCF|nr:hypothetical protein PILCRDRAFT_502086 [Piloderma croceum F 1598]
MPGPARPNPSVSLILSRESYPFRLPAYKESYLRRYHPYARSMSSRVVEFDNPLEVTINARYNGPRLDHLLSTIQEENTDDPLVVLHDVVPSKDDRARVSLSRFLESLALAIRQSVERLRVPRKGTEIQFDMLT